MSTSFLPYEPNQLYLLPPSPSDWLPEGHMALFVSDVVDGLDLTGFYARYEGDGRRNQPHSPTMMVKVLAYGYASGVFSSRQIAKKLHEDVAFRVLGAGNFPAHRTICDFRRLHLEELKALFVQVVGVARELGLVKLGLLGVDGTKIRANASKHKAMSYGRMKEEQARLKAEIGELLQRAERVDRAEDERLGVEVSGEALPEELKRREERLIKIEAAKARLEARQREADAARGRHEDDGCKPTKGDGRGSRFKREFGVPEDKAQENFTDPESRIMNTQEGYQQCYNAQAAVDGESQLILAAGLTNCASDNAQLLPMVKAAEHNVGNRPEVVLADAGYRCEQSFVALEQEGIEALVALGREGKAALNLDAERAPASARMAQKLGTEAGKARYRRRKVIPEPVFGWIKHVLGFKRFSLRGLHKVTAEWNLVCLAVNLKRMHVLMMPA